MKCLPICLVAFLFVQVYMVKICFAQILEEIELNQDEIASFVKLHNDFRRMRNSSDMMLMTWDEDIAKFAQDYTRNCNFGHSENTERVTEAFPQLGENLYSTSTSMSQIDRSRILRSVGRWYDEVEDYDYANLSCEPGEQCGHYTQVVWANSYKLGCGATVCQPTNPTLNHRYIVSCNYGPPGNYENEFPYTIGEPCSQCKDESDVCVTGLCANSNRGDVISVQASTTSQPEQPPTTFTTSTKAPEEPTTPTKTTAATTSAKSSTSPDTVQTTPKMQTTSSKLTPPTHTVRETTGSTLTTPTYTRPNTTPNPSTTGNPTPTTECGGEDLKQWRESFNKWKCQHEQYIAKYMAAEDGNDAC